MSDVIYNNSADFIFHNDGDIDTGDLWWMRNIPALTTDAVSDLTNISVTANGMITELGGENSTRRGFCYKIGDTGDPTIADTIVYDDGDFSLGAFLEAIASLTTGKKYQIRAYAVNTAGIGYGSTVYFITDLALSDSLSLADALLNNVGLNKSDLLDFGDVFANNPLINKSDSLALADALANNMGLSKSDLITLADAIASNVGINKSDSITLTDATLKNVLTDLQDALIIVDDVVKNISIPEFDTFILSDSVRFNILLQLQDTIDLTDAIVKNISVLLQDSFALTDALVNNSIKDLQEQILLADAIVKNISIVKDDHFHLHDDMNLFMWFMVTLSDTIVFRDSISKNIDRPIDDSFNLYDAIVKNASIPEQDMFNLSDGLIKNVQVSLQDAITISDTLIKNLVFVLQDQVTFIDDTIKNVTIRKTDSINFRDTFDRIVNFIRTVQDLFILRDDLITGVAELFRDMVIAGKVKAVLSQLKVKQVLSKTILREVLSENTRQVNIDIRRRQVMCTPVNEQGTTDLLAFSPKQNWEEYYVAFNFARVITPLTTIASTDIRVYDESGAEVSETLTDDTKTQITGTKVFVWVRGGTEQTYKITCKITMSNGEKFEQDATLEVTEV